MTDYALRLQMLQMMCELCGCPHTAQAATQLLVQEVKSHETTETPQS